jgi:tripartite-type tricarboxylate transporter receptor subunit TctC
MVIPASAAITHKTNPDNCTSANGVKIKNNQLVCRGLAFYKGQQMNFIQISSPGSVFDDQSQAEMTGLATYLGATLDTVDYTTGNTIPGQDAIAAASPNGLSVGLLNPLNDASLILEKEPGINFNPARMVYLSSTKPTATLLLALTGSGYSTFSQFLSAAKAGTARIVDEDTGSVNTTFRALLAATGAFSNANAPIWVTGYTSIGLEVAGWERDDAPLAVLPVSSVCPLLEDGQAVALATNVVPPLGTDCRKYITSLPTFADLAKTYGKTKAEKKLFTTAQFFDDMNGYPTVTQPGVAGYKIDALRAAMQWIYSSPAFKTTMLSEGVNPLYVSPVVAKQQYEKAVILGPTVICYVNSADACT